MKIVSHRRNAAGFTLLEILISILVLAIGLIGAAMMQLHATRTTEQSSLHDTALALATQIADDMRANDIEARQAPNPFIGFSYQASANPGSNPQSCYAQTCSTTQLASQTTFEWKQRIRDLPGGTLEICRDATAIPSASWCAGAATDPAAPVAIKIGWTERNPDGTSVTDTLPRVAILVVPFAP
jgi:type IV pilus assembly protein PilV